ncbi:hypothetical protein [Silvanigrella aquatica]|uniref:Spermidine/putrescine ABC transporter substrate-binding protein n=1 Tax=Silvanigrella aquatica TaxID=1915309 RepID=A0A1L4CX23_9BACT|nr:hypothetical protein [Silvanigrella aquatica]APJ02498.1 hypothetical protein AXG55_00525 [Silvanigrella aquatica]
MQIKSNRKVSLTVFVSSFLIQNAYANVSIASWWGYIDKATIEKLEKKCHTKITLDEYYTNDEFINNYQKKDYAVAIFSGSVYKYIIEDVEKKGISFEKITKNYDKAVLHEYENRNYSKKAALFSFTLSGFLYDKNKLKINENDSVQKIFQTAKNKKVIFLDESMESLKTLSTIKNISSATEGALTFHALVKGSHTVITNDIEKYVNDADFGLAYAWVGEAYKLINKNNSLEFKPVPAISNVSLDFIGTLNKNEDTACVAEALASKETLDSLLARDYYFSPFGTMEPQTDILFKKESVRFYENLGISKWMPHPSKGEYQEKSALWKDIKLELKN